MQRRHTAHRIGRPALDGNVGRGPCALCSPLLLRRLARRGRASGRTSLCGFSSGGFSCRLSCHPFRHRALLSQLMHDPSKGSRRSHRRTAHRELSSRSRRIRPSGGRLSRIPCNAVSGHQNLRQRDRLTLTRLRLGPPSTRGRRLRLVRGSIGLARLRRADVLKACRKLDGERRFLAFKTSRGR